MNVLRANPNAMIQIEGRCDKTGDVDVNQKVSYKRANVIKRYLISKGIADSNISIKGNGFDLTAESDAKARRADVKLYVTEK